MSLCLLASWSGLAQDKKPETKEAPAAAEAKPAANLPPAREVLDRFVKEIGGREAMLKHTSQSAKGKLTMPGQGLEGVLEVYAAKPDKFLLKVQLGALGSIVSGYDGKVGWSLNPLTGPMLVEGKALEQLKNQADFFKDLHEEKNYKSVETVDIVDFEGEKCHKLKLTLASGEKTTEYFSVKTGLQRGGLATQESQFGPVSVTSVAGDYKKFGDMLLPTRLSSKLSGLEQVMILTEVEFDKVPDSVFDLPSDIKILMQKKK